MRLDLTNDNEVFATEDFTVRRADIPVDQTKEDAPSVDGYQVVLSADGQVQGNTTSLATAIQAAYSAQQTLDQVRAAVQAEQEADSGQSSGLGSFLDLDLDAEGEEPEVH